MNRQTFYFYTVSVTSNIILGRPGEALRSTFTKDIDFF